MIPCLTLAENKKELDAQHLVCSYLVRACRHAMYELALEERSDPAVRHRAIEVLKVVHQDWLEAQKALARELGKAPRQSRTRFAPTTVIESSSRRWAETA
jgi:hypothetical protein